MPLSVRDALLEVGKAGWGTIDDLRSRISGVEGFNWYDVLKDDEHALRLVENAVIRREIRLLTDETGFPVITSIKRPNPDTGEVERVYKQEALFDIDDYRQVVSYWTERTNYGARMARSYRDRAQSRLHVQIPLQFDLDGTADGAA